MPDEPQRKIDFKILTADNLLSNKEAAIKKVDIDKRDNLVIENKPEVVNIEGLSNNNTVNNNSVNNSPSPLSSLGQDSSNISFLNRFSSLLTTSKTEKKEDVNKAINIVYDQNLLKDQQDLNIDKKDSSLFYQPTVKEILQTTNLTNVDKKDGVSSLKEPVAKQSLVYKLSMFFVIILFIAISGFYILKDNPFISRLWKNENEQTIIPVINIRYVDPFAKTTETLTTTETTTNDKNDNLAIGQFFSIVTFTPESKKLEDERQNLTTSSTTVETLTTSLTTSEQQNASFEQSSATAAPTTIDSGQLTSSPTKEKTEIDNDNKLVDKNINHLPAFQKLDFTDNFKSLPIDLDNNSTEALAKALKTESLKLKPLNSIYYLDFSVNNDEISITPVVDYFIKPNKTISSLVEKFKNNLTGNFALLFYYGYTRVYPILVLEIKDRAIAKSFMELWEKKGMSNDLQTIFLVNAKLSPLTKDFAKNFYQNIEYKTQNFEKNFVLLWSVVNQYLVIASTDKRIDYLLSILSDY